MGEPHAVSADGEGGERGGAQQVAAVGAVQGQPLQARGRLYAAAQAGAGRGAQLQAGQMHQRAQLRTHVIPANTAEDQFLQRAIIEPAG